MSLIFCFCTCKCTNVIPNFFRKTDSILENIDPCYKGVEYNVFEIDLSEPWKYKFVPDVGRVPVRKTSAKRLLSVSGSGYSEAGNIFSEESIIVDRKIGVLSRK